MKPRPGLYFLFLLKHDLTLYAWLTSVSKRSPCLCFLRAGIKGVLPPVLSPNTLTRPSLEKPSSRVYAILARSVNPTKYLLAEGATRETGWEALSQSCCSGWSSSQIRQSLLSNCSCRAGIQREALQCSVTCLLPSAPICTTGRHM